jgi:hypothetical protein
MIKILKVYQDSEKSKSRTVSPMLCPRERQYKGAFFEFDSTFCSGVHMDPSGKEVGAGKDEETLIV